MTDMPMTFADIGYVGTLAKGNFELNILHVGQYRFIPAFDFL